MWLEVFCFWVGEHMGVLEESTEILCLFLLTLLLISTIMCILYHILS